MDALKCIGPLFTIFDKVHTSKTAFSDRLNWLIVLHEKEGILLTYNNIKLDLFKNCLLKIHILSFLSKISVQPFFLQQAVSPLKKVKNEIIIKKIIGLLFILILFLI